MKERSAKVRRASMADLSLVRPTRNWKTMEIIGIVNPKIIRKPVSTISNSIMTFDVDFT